MENTSGVRDGSQRKERVKAVLLGLKEVVSMLQGVAEMNPIAGPCIAALRTVVTLELDRQDNEEQFASVYQIMTTMAEALTAITPTLIRNEGLASRLKSVLENMQNKVDEFGTYSRRHYRRKLAAKFIRATAIKAELQAFATAFAQHQQSLLLVLSVRTTITANEILDSLTLLTSESMQRADVSNEQEVDEAAVVERIDTLATQLEVAKGTVLLGLENLNDLDAVEASQGGEIGSTGSPFDTGIVMIGETALEVSMHMRTTQQTLEAMEGVVATLRRLLVSQPRAPANAFSAAVPPLVSSPSSSPLSPSPSSPIVASPSPTAPAPAPAPAPTIAALAPTTAAPALPVVPSSPQGGQYTALVYKSAAQRHLNLRFEESSIGPDHQRTWTVQARIEGKVRGVGQASKKADAKESAAQNACTALGWVF